MKKDNRPVSSKKKLSLAKQTLRALTDRELSQVAGGSNIVAAPVWTDGCTYLCD